MKQIFYCNTYQERINILVDLINAGENIYLFGNGNNGKTTIINELKQFIKEKGYNLLPEKTGPGLPPLYPYIGESANTKFICQSNYNPNNDVIDSNFVPVRFVGKYNPVSSKYE